MDRLIILCNAFLFLFCTPGIAQSITWQQTKGGYTPTSFLLLDSAVITIGKFSNSNCGYERPMFISYNLFTGDTNYTMEWASDTCYNYFPVFSTGLSQRQNFALSTGYLDGVINSSNPGGVLRFRSSSWDTLFRSANAGTNISLDSDSTFYLVSASNANRILQYRNINSNLVLWTDTLPSNTYIIQNNESTSRITVLTTTNATQGIDAVIITFSSSGNILFNDTIALFSGNESVRLWGETGNGETLFSARPTSGIGRNRILKYDPSNGIIQEIDQVTSTVIDDGFITNDGNYLFYVGKDGTVSNSLFYIYKADLNLNAVVDSFTLPNLASIISEVDGQNGYLFVSQSIPVASGRQHNIVRYTYNFNPIDSVVLLDTINNAAQGELIAISPDALIYVTGYGSLNSVYYRLDFSPLGVNHSSSICTISESVVTTQFWQGVSGQCKPTEMVVFDILGSMLNSKTFPTSFDFQTEQSGVYIIQVLFENGDVKREKVFLTAH